MATAVKSEIQARLSEWDMPKKAIHRRLSDAEQLLAGSIRGLSHPIEFVNAQSRLILPIQNWCA